MEKLNINQSAVSALKALGDGSIDYAVFQYENNNTLKCDVSGVSGSGSYASIVPYFTPATACYAMLRKTHLIDKSLTVKFILVIYMSEDVNPMRKAVLATHVPQARAALKPIHVDFVINEPSELSDAQIEAKIAAAAGTAIHEVDKSHLISSLPPAKQAALAAASSSASSSSSVASQKPQANTASRTLTVLNEDALKRAIADVRDDQSPVNWLLIGYANQDPSSLQLVATGDGDVSQLVNSLDESTIQYGMFRACEQYDATTRVFFCYVKWMGPSTPIRLKSQVSTHAGFVTSLLAPVHTDFEMDSKSELSTDIVSEKLKALMGKKNLVKDIAEKKDNAAASVLKKSTPGPLASSSKVSASVTVVNGDAFRQALHAVHQDCDDTTWLIATYASNMQIELACSGAGDVTSMISHFQSDKVNYGLIRVVDMIDGHRTLKFVFIVYQPETLSPMQKARVGTQNAAISELFRPYHVDFFTENPVVEITQQIVVDKVTSASGSKIHVK